jgi:hypothetical protein
MILLLSSGFLSPEALHSQGEWDPVHPVSSANLHFLGSLSVPALSPLVVAARTPAEGPFLAAGLSPSPLLGPSGTHLYSASSTSLPNPLPLHLENPSHFWSTKFQKATSTMPPAHTGPSLAHCFQSLRDIRSIMLGNIWSLMSSPPSMPPVWLISAENKIP